MRELYKSEDVVKWLIHSETETPKSVLRERAEYYEQEFNSLKELTSRENFILMTDHTAEMEILQAELIHIKSELERDKIVKREQETKFLEEKKKLELKLDEVKKKNDELSKILQKVQKDNEQQNDCEYLVDMYKEKYKKREKELLDSLQEAREQLKSNINNTDDEKYQIISTDVSISVDMKVFLEECKNQLRVLKLELESEQPMSIIKKIFNEIKKLNEEMLVNCTDCSEDLQDLLNVFKFMFDLSSILLTDDVVILELEKEKFQLQHREKTYELLVSKQDEEIKHLSENILQYMNELAFHKNEVTKYKEIAKSETSLHTDLDFSIMTTDTKNMTDYDLNNESTFNQSELILKSDQYVQTEEDFLGLIQSKDKEIEDLSDKIMEYIEQLMALEQEFNQLKSVSKADKSFLDNKLMKEKDDKITELTKAVYKNDEKIIKYVAELQSEKEKVQEKDTEIEDLSDNIMNYLSEISNLNDEINLMNVQLQSEKDLINTKDEEIKNLILQIEELKTKLFDTNDQELTELTEKVKSSEQLFVQENYESFIKAKNPDVRDTDRNIKDLLSKVTEYKIKINAVENELSGIKEELQEYKLKMQEDKKIIQLKDNQIAVLNDQIIDLTETMHASQNELEKCNNLITTKDIEIQELLCKLTDAENEICDCKSNADIDNDIIECKNKEIKEIRADIINYTNKLSTADAMIQEYQSDLKLQKDLTDSKTKEFDKLADNIFDYVHKLSITETNLEKCENDLKIEKELLNIKVSEIEKLSSDILDYVTHLSTAEEEIKTYKSDLQNQNKLLKLKDEEIEELSSQIMDYIDQLSAVESELNKCKSSGDTESDQILLKTKEVQELTSKIVNYEKQLISTEEKIKNYKSDIEEKIELLDSKNTEIEDLMKKVTIFGNQINEFEKLTELKNLEIQELHSKILYCNKQIKEYQVYESQLEEYENLIKLKDDEIKNVTKKLVKFKDDIFEKNKIINNYMRDLEIEKDTSKKTDEHIQNIKKEYYKQITEFEEAIDNLKSALNKKDEIIVHRENDIKSLNDKINQYSKQLDALNLRNEKLTQHSSEYEMFRMKIIAEEVKSIEYVNKIKSLEQQLLLSNDQAKQMEQEYEVVKTSNLNYCTMIKSLQNEICTLQGHVAQQECSFKQYKDELGLERNIILENDTLLRDTNLTEMQKATDKLQKNRNHIENLQKELVSVQNNNTELTKEIAKLKKKNEDYKKIVAEVTERANSKIGSYNNIGIKLKRDNDLLKMQIRAEEEKNIKTLNQLIVVQEELKKKDNSYEIDKLQTKINNLEEKNKKLVEIIEDYQEQLYMKGNEFNAMKKTVETLKYENSELHQINRNLNDKLYETEVLLKSARSNVQLLEKENEHYNNSSRNLEESLEDLKFELYELKNKEREKFKKAKRQSLHDSSRSLSSDEQLNINNENQQLKLPFFESNKSDETKSNECEKCKQRMPLSDRQIDEQRDKVTKLQKDNEILRKKCDQVQNLCRARKNKIDELEKQVQAYKTQ